jgi:uncharacterized iron-regulated membrane protein
MCIRMPNKLRKVSRHLHLWISLSIFIPVIIVIGSGILLQVKKEIDWIQPPTQKVSRIASQKAADTSSTIISSQRILEAVRTVSKAQLTRWEDIDRLDIRPSKGIIKVRGNNHWEVQLNAYTGAVLQTAYRRTDTIESIHDGSWFFEGAKLFLFLPVALLLFVIWLTGIVMLFTTLKSKYRKKQARLQQHR